MVGSTGHFPNQMPQLLKLVQTSYGAKKCTLRRNLFIRKSCKSYKIYLGRKRVEPYHWPPQTKRTKVGKVMTTFSIHVGTSKNIKGANHFYHAQITTCFSLKPNVKYKYILLLVSISFRTLYIHPCLFLTLDYFFLAVATPMRVRGFPQEDHLRRFVG